MVQIVNSYLLFKNQFEASRLASAETDWRLYWDEEAATKFDREFEGRSNSFYPAKQPHQTMFAEPTPAHNRITDLLALAKLF